MASRKDFAQKKGGSSGANRSRSSNAPRQTRSAPPPPQKQAPRVLLLVTLVAVAGLAYGLYRLTALQSPTTPQTVSVPAPKAPAPKPAPKPAPVAAAKPAQAPAATEDDEEQRRFEFYEMLPKSEVEAPQVDAYKSTPRTAKLEHSYLLQAGSFRDPADAERMRAQLLLAGLPNVTTSRVDGANGTWYRVRTGPFTNRQDMNKAENKMAKLSIQPMQIKQ